MLPDKSCIEMKQLHRQTSSTSTDTYASCTTHPQDSPSNLAQPTAESPKHNLYVNPLDVSSPRLPNPPSHYPPYHGHFNDLHEYYNHQPPPPPQQQQETGFNRPSVQFCPNQVVQKLDSGLTTTWECESLLPNPPQSPDSSGGRQQLRTSMPPPKKSSFKRYKSLSVEKHPRFADIISERNCSSTDNLHSQEFIKPKLKFRKAVSLANRLHASSPSTGRRLANYHLIANTKSGKIRRNLFNVMCYILFSNYSVHGHTILYKLGKKIMISV